MGSGYNPIVRSDLYKLPLDFFARRTHFIDHIVPIWFLLKDDEKGFFYVPEHLMEYATDLGIPAVPLKPPNNKKNKLSVRPPGKTPMLTCAYDDMGCAFQQYAYRPLFLMEHGVGLSFETHPGYGGGRGLRRRVALFLPPNKIIRGKTRKTFPDAPQVIIGTPKMDWVRARKPERKKKPVICISFHWDGKKVTAEAGNALNHYIDILPELSEKFDMIGHGHPKIIDKLVPIYEACGITEIEHDFDNVLKNCDIYINDASSTLYEFACTGKPVIFMNAPWFDRNKDWGIRFWNYTDIGVNVDEPEDLIPAIVRTIKNPAEFYDQRLRMIDHLYPYIGQSAGRTADALNTFLESKRNGTTFDFTQA